jgi:hypothetical protein
MFYDSVGTYHTPTFEHVVNNLLLGTPPLIVPVVLAFGAWLQKPNVPTGSEHTRRPLLRNR